MKTYTLSTASRFINPRWLRQITGKTVVTEVDQQGQIIVEGEVLSIADPAARGSLPPGTKVVVWLGAHFTACKYDAYRARHELAMDQAKLAYLANRRRNRQRRRDNRAFNLALNIPVNWTPGIKEVLSGLSPHSNGDGCMKNTVVHILLKDPLHVGRLKRGPGDFLCANSRSRVGANWSGAPEKPGHRVTCKTCLKLAKRFTQKEQP
jgi:hypothetical protein